jgi:hypothetical protein
MKIQLTDYNPGGVSTFMISSGPMTMWFEMESETGKPASVMPLVEPYATKAHTEARILLSQRNRHKG